MNRLRATILAALAVASFVAAAPRDNAVIVNSGSTNSMGYSIDVWSDGTASVTLQRHGSAAGTPKPFTVAADTTKRFFADLAAARKGNVATVPCMKSVSFGTSTHVHWQGWVSPDLTCPPKDSLGEALVNDVEAIRKASGISAMPPRQP
jgi:FtsP/CotA-like multicopper oxidase with cupredoxin domain